jgi:hypothetical protein
MAILLINAVGKQLIEELGCETYEEYSNNLVLDGFLGLEHYNRAHIIEIYNEISMQRKPKIANLEQNIKSPHEYILQQP